MLQRNLKCAGTVGSLTHVWKPELKGFIVMQMCPFYSFLSEPSKFVMLVSFNVYRSEVQMLSPFFYVMAGIGLNLQTLILCIS